MNNRIILPLLLVVFVVSDVYAQNRFHRRRGAVVGGIAGAAIGAAIGDDRGNAAAGAIIGGVAGAATGGAIGARRDRRIEGQYYHSQPTPAQGPSYYQPHVYQHAPAQPHMHVDGRPYVEQPMATGVSMSDVVTMVRRGLPEKTIVQHIRINGVQRRLQIADIITLHEQGVSEPILSAMQTAPLLIAQPTPVEVPPVGSGPQFADPYGQSVLEPNLSPNSPPPPPQPWNLVPAN